MGAIIAENIYGKYSIPEGLGHRPAVRLVQQGDVYEPKTIRFMTRMAGDGDIVHAGTFFGDFLPGLSKNMAQGRKIWAFEPNPNSFQHAARTIELNRLENVALQNLALSNQSGQIHFRTQDKQGRPMGGHSHFVEQGGEGIEQVEACRLDDVIPLERRVSILQLDVEGHERAALLGARAIIEKWKPILLLEGFRRPRWIRVNFRGLGYRRVGELHNNQIFATEEINVRAKARS